jgi:hypothetical protein
MSIGHGESTFSMPVLVSKKIKIKKYIERAQALAAATVTATAIAISNFRISTGSRYYR